MKLRCIESHCATFAPGEIYDSMRDNLGRLFALNKKGFKHRLDENMRYLGFAQFEIVK